MRAIDWVPGAVIAARYRLVRRVGEGGMGVIWAADDLVADRRTALKRIKDPVDDPATRRRFLHEARAASVVRHPNVVEVFDVLELEDGPPALAMELLDGESLRDVLVRDRTLSVPALADILVPVISAVGAAHALGVVHRDLKPENIFLARSAGGERVVKVLDFGIAKLTALDGEAMRSAGLTTTAVLGTPAYMAPEQVFGERDIDHRADVWALGVVVYECLAGVRPTDGDNVGQVLKHVVAKPFVPLAQRVDDLPDSVSRLVERMLMRERSYRPADLHEAVAVLEPFASAPAAPFDAPAAHFARAGDAAVADTVLIERRSSEAEALLPARDRVAPSPQPARWRSRRGILLGLAGALALLGLGLVRPRCSSPEPPMPIHPPLADPLTEPASKLACPILRVSGVDEPAGWLGAAAAAIACERARLLFGGRGERTLVPAELLGLPREPTDKFPQAPYDAPGARADTLAAARRLAQAYLDGEVTSSSPGFMVVLTLHRADGTEIARSEGRGQALYEAVRSAEVPLVGASAIPHAGALDREVAAWSRTDNVDDALRTLDLTFALDENTPGLQDECTRFGERAAHLGELGVEGRWMCAYTLGQPPLPVNLQPPDHAGPGRATTIRINHEINQKFEPGDAAFLRELFEHEPTARGRSLLAATESCLLQSTDPQAHDRALLAVQSDPRNTEGGLCNPWDQLLTLERAAGTADRAAIAAMQAWMPWKSYAWAEPALRLDGDDPAALPMLERAHRLSPFDARIADLLARTSLATGDRTAARSVAAELSRGPRPLHALERDLILSEIDASEARFGTALDRAQSASQIAGAEASWVLVQRFKAGWRALELAVLLGRPRAVADQLVRQFIAPEPAPLDSNDLDAPKRIPAICVLASKPGPCFQRLRQLRPQLAGAVTHDNDDFLAGAEFYATQEYARATAKWRPLFEGKTLPLVLPEIMVDAFEHANARDLAERLDLEVMKRAAEFHGATLGHVREAHRALARNRPEEARRLAQQVIDAWSLADDVPPAVADMQQLLARLPRP